MEGPHIAYEQKGYIDTEAGWRLAKTLIDAYAVLAVKATAAQKEGAQWKIVRIPEKGGPAEDAFYMHADTVAQFNAGKIAQLINRISVGEGRLEVRPVEKE